MGVISESGKCCGPCMILNDNFTTYIVTSWPIPHRCSLIYRLRSSFGGSSSPPPLPPPPLIVKMVLFFMFSPSLVDFGSLI